MNKKNKKQKITKYTTLLSAVGSEMQIEIESINYFFTYVKPHIKAINGANNF